MWHVSISVWSQSGKRLHQPSLAEKKAITFLSGVGGEREWWYWNPVAMIGHLRIGVTDEEYAVMPPCEAVDDAGETGLERLRFRG